MEQIKIENISWNPEKKDRPVIKNVSTVLHSGEIYGILGPNGAGKTSLVRQLLKLIKNDTGVIKLDEQTLSEISRQGLAERISFLPQSFNVEADFTVYDVVAMGREPYRKSFAALCDEDKRIIEEALTITNCQQLRNKSITVLSGGERQRVMIARTIAQDTPWIILDEPVSNLDVKHQVNFMLFLSRLYHEKGKTVIVILHDLNLAAEFCTRLILMKQGQIVAEGTVEEVLTKENLKEAYDMEFAFLENPKDTIRKMPYLVPIYTEK